MGQIAVMEDALSGFVAAILEDWARPNGKREMLEANRGRSRRLYLKKSFRDRNHIIRPQKTFDSNLLRSETLKQRRTMNPGQVCDFVG